MITAIPGHIYLDDKGVKLVYLGYGTYSRVDPSLGSLGGWSTNCKKYLYMKYDDIVSKMQKGKLSQDLKEYNKNFQGSSADFFKTVFFSSKPRQLVNEVGQLYPENYFLKLTVTDYTNANVNLISLWIIDTQ